MCEGHYKLRWLYSKIMLCDSLWETWFHSHLKQYESKFTRKKKKKISASWTWMTE